MKSRKVHVEEVLVSIELQICVPQPVSVTLKKIISPVLCMVLKHGLNAKEAI
jgi:hypothetical protein